MTEPRIDTDLVRSLIADQFPQWSDLSITPVKTSGWDNRTYHLGDDMAVRLPSAARYAPQVEKEQRWLSYLAPHLPLPIPDPIAMGQASKAYPFAWSIRRWLSGDTALATADVNKPQLANDLGQFISALQATPAKHGPEAGAHNFHRGGDLRIYDQEVRHSLNQLGDIVDQSALRRLWTRACHSSWTAAPVWVHGDLSAENFLCQNGQLSAVIDFGNCGIGDPACDLTIAWAYFDDDSRAVFKQVTNLDDDTWARAKGWGLWKALLMLCQGKLAAQDTLQSIIAD